MFNNFKKKIMPFVIIVWKNTVESDRPRMMIWRMRVACWIPKATNTHSEYVILIAVPLQHWLHERASLLFYTCTARLVFRHLTCSSRPSNALVSPSLALSRYCHFRISRMFLSSWKPYCSVTVGMAEFSKK